MQQTKQKITVAIVSDLHIGSTVGIMPPEVTLDEGLTVSQSKSQEWLYDNWCDFWDTVKAVGNQKCYLFVLGDTFDNFHHGTTQLWSLNEVAWFRAATDLFDLPLSLCQKRFVIRGTLAHTKSGGIFDEEFGNMIDAEQDGNNYSSWRRSVYVDNVLFDLCHRGPLGQLPWTIGNALNRYSYEVLAECHSLGTPVPNVVLRSHNHLYGTSGDGSPVFTMSIPAWQLKTEYTYGRNAVRLASIGGIIFECWDNTYIYHKQLYTPQEREAWRIESAKKS